MAADESTVRFIVAGRVQGVGFRMFVRMHAISLGVRGWVRNLRSGEVEAVAAGSRDQLDQLKALMGRGPVGAQVTRIDDFEIDPPENMPGAFEIRR